MKILFVCLGNICRSPMAEYIMKNKCKQLNLDWKIASAGTENYHIGKGADDRGLRTALNFGIDMQLHKAKQLTPSDFDNYDIIYSMAIDVTNEMGHIGSSEIKMNKVKLFMDELFPEEKKSVPDPWYGDEKDFIPVYKLIEKVCEKIISNHNIHKLSI